MFKGLEAEDLERLLEKVKAEYGEDKLLKYLSEDPPNRVRHHVDWLHTMCCDLDHESGECPYYEEDQLSTCWQQMAHEIWLRNYYDILTKYNMTVEQFHAGCAGVRLVISDVARYLEPVHLVMHAVLAQNPFFLLPKELFRKAPAPEATDEVAVSDLGTALLTAKLSAKRGEEDSY